MSDSLRRQIATALVVTTGAVLAAATAAPAATYRLSAAPEASFFWFPPSPRVNEQVTFVSTSTDLTSAITGFAWDFADNGPFGPFLAGSPSATTSFATPAPHVARLRVTNDEGLSTVAERTIQMSASTLVISPFPIVRIIGTRTRTGVRLNMLAVQAPRDAVIAISCRVAHCPRPLRAVRATASGRGRRYVRFRRYARRYPNGSKIEVRITKSGFVGAYTSFAVRAHHIPRRTDACLGTSNGPVACPS
jgi:PKD repeat protein